MQQLNDTTATTSDVDLDDDGRPRFVKTKRKLKTMDDVQLHPLPPAEELSKSELLKAQAKIIRGNRTNPALGERAGKSGIARTIADTPSATNSIPAKTDPKKLAIMMRRQFVVNLRTSGMSYNDISDAVIEAAARGELFEVPPSYNRNTAYLDVQRYLNELRSTIQDNLIDVIDLENSRLDALLRAVWSQAMQGDTRSVRASLDIMERRSKLLGLDAAIKVDWRIELRGLEKAGLLSDMAIREELGPEGYANYRQFIDEVDVETGKTPGALLSPIENTPYVRTKTRSSSNPVLPGFEDALAIAIEEQRLQGAAGSREWPTAVDGASGASGTDDGGELGFDD